MVCSLVGLKMWLSMTRVQDLWSLTSTNDTCLPTFISFCAPVCVVCEEYYKIIWLYSYNFWGFNTHFSWSFKVQCAHPCQIQNYRISNYCYYYCSYFLTAILPMCRDRVPHVDNIIKHHFCPCLGCCNVDTIINHQFGHCLGCKM